MIFSFVGKNFYFDIYRVGRNPREIRTYTEVVGDTEIYDFEFRPLLFRLGIRVKARRAWVWTLTALVALLTALVALLLLARGMGWL